jgi:DNA-binding NtrC family response regulator
VCEQLSQSSSGIIDEENIRQHLREKAPVTQQAPDWIEQVFHRGLNSLIKDIEKQSVEEALRRNKGKVTACIKDLGISSSAFYRILQENQLRI